MIIGVTGGVGVGKSTVLSLLKENHGAHLIMADDVAKELMEPGGASYEPIVTYFGTGILEAEDAGNGRKIDRKRLAEVVFQDENKLEILNSMTHPKVKEEILNQIRKIYQEDPCALIVVEAALLIEAGYTDMLDQLWVVSADPEVRIERLMASRGYSREKTLSIMENQLSEAEFRSHADFVIDNSGSLEETERQIQNQFQNMDPVWSGSGTE